METAGEFKQKTNPWTLKSVVGYQLRSRVRSTEAIMIQPQSIALVSAHGLLICQCFEAAEKLLFFKASFIKLYIRSVVYNIAG